MGDAEGQHPPAFRALLNHVPVVPHPAPAGGGPFARRARADDRNLLSGFGRRWLRLHPALLEGAVGDRALDGLDGDGVVVDVERAGGFARRRADPAGDFGEVVGGMEIARSLLPLVAIDEIVPVRDLIVDRTTGVAIGNATIHAACGLLLGLRLRQGAYELAPMLDALFDRLVVAVLALVFQ